MLKKYNMRNKLIFSFILSILTIFFMIQGSVLAASGSNTLSEVKNIVNKYYVEDVPENVLNSSNIDDLIKGLNDPYTKYFSKEDLENFNSQINNSFCGIGIYCAEDQEGVKVESVIKGSPAEEKEIKKGDIIIWADGISLKGKKLEEANSYIKGEEGTSVNLVIKRENNILNMMIDRKKVVLPTVVSDIVYDHIGYIRITSFGENTPKEFLHSLNDMKSKVDSFIIDLRDNLGGYTNSAYNIAGNFVGDDVVTVMKDKKDNIKIFKGMNHGYVIDKPTVFLVNRYSASSSELLSAAVKDYKKAIFVGEVTYGKGVQQIVFPLTDGSYLKLTTNEFYSPSGKVIHEKGIAPDISINDANPLIAATLLLSEKSNSTDKSGYLKVEIAGKDYEINLNEGEKIKNLEAFKCIVNSSSNNLYLGTKEGWSKISKSYFDDEEKAYFSEYEKLTNINSSVIPNEKINILFNGSVDSNTVNNDNVKLVTKDELKDIKLNFQFNTKNKITIIPKENLEKGKEYYLLIKNVKNHKGVEINNKKLIKLTARS